MGKLLRWIALAALLGAGYYWIALDSRMPVETHYTLDIAKVRALADSIPGDKPREVRYEHVFSFNFLQAMVVAGDPWTTVEIPVYSYQLVYPDHTALIDTAMARAIVKPDFMRRSYDDAAFDRVQNALGKARWITITHEHMDHIGGIAVYPDPLKLIPALRLTDVQMTHPERMKPAVLPPELYAQYKPIHYEHYLALAPGVVLIAAAGHTPGAQMVYVKRADGKELLFLGDVTWQARNIEIQRERPRWVTGPLIQEDRDAVFGEIKALHDLMQSHPEIHQVPGHDGPAIADLTLSNMLIPGFLP